MSFKYVLGAALMIAISGEVGQVVGRGEFSTSENQYLLRYQEFGGSATEKWWSESALTEADENEDSESDSGTAPIVPDTSLLLTGLGSYLSPQGVIAEVPDAENSVPADSVTQEPLVAGAITSDQIAAGSITATDIKSGVIADTVGAYDRLPADNPVVVA